MGDTHLWDAMIRPDGALAYAYEVDPRADAPVLRAVVPGRRAAMIAGAIVVLGVLLLVLPLATGGGFHPLSLAAIVGGVTLWLLPHRRVSAALRPLEGARVDVVLSPAGYFAAARGSSGTTAWSEYDRWVDHPDGFLLRRTRPIVWQLLPTRAIPEPERALVRSALTRELGPAKQR